jgi:hypothetical protein
MGRKVIDITGQKFGRLTAISIARKEDKIIYWKFLCDCGSEQIIASFPVRKGLTKSCGCIQIERNTIHGMTGTRIHTIWNGMRERCKNKKANNYHNYGGRGIKVCDRWLDFSNFYEDMGNPPDGMSLDRKDNNGNYEPLNCRWATRKEQNNNTSVNRFLEFNGDRKTLSQWADTTGIRLGTIWSRLKSGWSVERSLTTPLQINRK